VAPVSEMRLAALITQVIFKEFPEALQDPFNRIARDFDPSVQFPPELGSVSQLRLEPEKTVVTVATQLASVRVADPENDDEAIDNPLVA